MVKLTHEFLGFIHQSNNPLAQLSPFCGLQTLYLTALDKPLPNVILSLVKQDRVLETRLNERKLMRNVLHIAEACGAIIGALFVIS